MATKNAEKNIKITKIVFGVVQLILNLFKNKHGNLPATLQEFQEEAASVKELNSAKGSK